MLEQYLFRLYYYCCCVVPTLGYPRMKKLSLLPPDPSSKGALRLEGLGPLCVNPGKWPAMAQRRLETDWTRVGGGQETWVQVHLFSALDFAPGAYVMARLD